MTFRINFLSCILSNHLNVTFNKSINNSQQIINNSQQTINNSQQTINNSASNVNIQHYYHHHSLNLWIHGKQVPPRPRWTFKQEVRSTDRSRDHPWISRPSVAMPDLDLVGVCHRTDQKGLPPTKKTFCFSVEGEQQDRRWGLWVSTATTLHLGLLPPGDVIQHGGYFGPFGQAAGRAANELRQGEEYNFRFE